MMIKYSGLNLTLRWITLAIAIGSLLFCTILKAFPLEPFDLEIFLEWDHLNERTEEARYEDASKKVQEGTATEEEKKVVTGYFLDHMVSEIDRGTSTSNDGGTFSMETNFADRDRDS